MRDLTSNGAGAAAAQQQSVCDHLVLTPPNRCVFPSVRPTSGSPSFLSGVVAPY